MRKFTLLFSALVLGSTAMKAQTIATFEALTLAHADTFYTNYTASGTDVGFNNGLAHFPCVYDTSFGGYWDHGFAYSNMTDSVTSGYTNGYSAKAGSGVAGSAQYVVGYGSHNLIKLTGAALNHPVQGVYVTNNTYAYNSMRDGDAFAHKFHNGDWFLLKARGYSGGVLKADSATFYLANFLFPDSTHNYIVKDWAWFNLNTLGNVDSIQFTLTSSDNGMFGMNTPAYFCMDNFKTYETFGEPLVSVGNAMQSDLKMYPNPATTTLYVDCATNNTQQITISDLSGKIVNSFTTTDSHIAIDIANLATGMYVLQMNTAGKVATMNFVKK